MTSSQTDSVVARRWKVFSGKTVKQSPVDLKTSSDNRTLSDSVTQKSLKTWSRMCHFQCVVSNLSSRQRGNVSLPFSAWMMFLMWHSNTRRTKTLLCLYLYKGHRALLNMFLMIIYKCFLIWSLYICKLWLIDTPLNLGQNMGCTTSPDLVYKCQLLCPIWHYCASTTVYIQFKMRKRSAF